ncbi:MAG: PAS domain S-box protein [Myxococcales bacterium]|nr:PAS domain S-box protein [Myxococcales bacterium]
MRQVGDDLRACGFASVTLEASDAAAGLIAQAHQANDLAIDADRAALPVDCPDLMVAALVIEHPGLAADPALVAGLRDAATVIDLALRALIEATARRAQAARYDQLFDHMRNGFAHCRAIFDGDRCIDWEYLRVNEAFARQTGLDAAPGRLVSQLIDGVRAHDPVLFARYGAVARGGDPVRFEYHVAALDEWFEVAAYHAGPDEFVAVFDVITERKRTEARLHASEHRFRAMFEQAAVGIALMGPNGEFRRANPRLCATLGYTEAELQRLTFVDITHDDHAASDRALHGPLTGGALGTVVLEKQLVRKDGGAVWHHVTIAGADADPDERTFVVIAEDVSAQRAAERGRAESENRLRLFVEHAPAAIAMFDRDMRYLAVSRRFITDCHLPDGDLVGRRHDEVFPNLPPHWQAMHARALAGAIERSAGEAFVRPDGEVEWVRWELYPWRDASGAIGGCVLFGETLTEQRRLALALATSEARHRAIFEQAGVGIALVEPATGRFVDGNAALCRIFRYSRAELQQRSWRDITPPEDVAQTPPELFDRAVPSVTIHKRYRCGDGTLIAGRVTVTRMTAPDGAALNLAFVEDVTEQRRAEEALRESQRRLAVVFEQSLAGMAIIRTRDRTVADVSESLVRMLGWSRDEWVGRDPDQLGVFLDPHDRLRLRALGGHTPTPIELQVRRKSGEVGDFLLSIGRIEIDGEPCSMCLLHDITELRRADAARIASERHLAALIELAPVGITEIDLTTGRPRWVNARLCELTGYTAAELGAMSIIDDLTDPADRAASRALAAGLGGGTPERSQLEKRYRTKDGRTVWTDVAVAVLRGAAGEVTGALSTIRDITEQRAARDALELQAQALNAAANAIVITDLRGVIERVNPALVALTGYPADELVGADMRIFSSGRQTPAFYRTLWQTITAGQVWRGELINRRQDGSHYHEEMTITPVRDAAGQISRYVAIKQDVSERYLAEAALRRSEARYRALVDDLEDLVLATDLDHRLTFVNRAVAAFGFTPAALLGRTVDDLVPPDDLPAWRELLSADVEPPPRELRIYDAAGKPRTVRARGRRRPIDDPEPGMTLVLIDLTTRRETEEQLRAAQKMEAVGRLAGGVAHDFNNLLSVILSYTDLAVADLHAADPLRADLQEVLAAAHRAEGLTRQLLAFSRKQVLNPEPTALAELVAGLAKMLRRLIGEDVELTLRDVDTAALVTVDRGQLEQVLMNLVVNARDAMPGGGHVTITTAELDLDTAAAHAVDLPPGRYLELAVADTGCGIDQATQQRIFEPFFTTKGVGKGTGLGLSMVYGIVRQSGGAVTVESEPGHGATFRVFLPARDPRAPAPPHRTAPVRLDRGDETVLVVEDEAALRSVVQRVLATAGYEVLVAANATEALLLADRHGARVRLILTDVVMPAMSGPELVERLRPRCPAAAVIFMSGYTDDALARFGVLAADFLRKPFDLRVLTARVRGALDQAAGT